MAESQLSSGAYSPTDRNSFGENERNESIQQSLSLENRNAETYKEGEYDADEDEEEEDQKVGVATAERSSKERQRLFTNKIKARERRKRHKFMKKDVQQRLKELTEENYELKRQNELMMATLLTLRPHSFVHPGSDAAIARETTIQNVAQQPMSSLFYSELIHLINGTKQPSTASFQISTEHPATMSASSRDSQSVTSLLLPHATGPAPSLRFDGHAQAMTSGVHTNEPQGMQHQQYLLPGNLNNQQLASTFAMQPVVEAVLSASISGGMQDSQQPSVPSMEGINHNSERSSRRSAI